MVDADPRADALAESRTGVGPAAPTRAWVKYKAGAWFSFDIRRNEAWMGADIDEFRARSQNTEDLGEGPLGVVKVGVCEHRPDQIKGIARKGQLTRISLDQVLR